MQNPNIDMDNKSSKPIVGNLFLSDLNRVAYFSANIIFSNITI